MAILTHLRRANHGGHGGAGTDPGTTNLLLWYEFNDRFDSHSGGYDLTEHGTPNYVTGKEGNAVNLVSADSEYLSRADSAGISPTGAQSWSFWVNPDVSSPASNEVIWAKYNPSADQRQFQFVRQPDETFIAALSSDGTLANTVNTTTTGTLAASTWTHVVLVFDPSTSIKIYLDGSLDVTNTTSIPASIHDSTEEMKIGSFFSVSNFFDGQIDEARWYTESLTADHVTYLYNNPGG